MASAESYKEFLEIVDLGLALGNFVGLSLEDNSFDFEDLQKLGPVVEKIGPAVKDGNKAMDVLLDGLTARQFKDLEEHILEKFDIPQDKLEEAIEWAITLIFSLFEGVQFFKKINKK